MIAIVEPICTDWVHENVNAGMIKLISNSYSDVHFFSEEKHGQAITKLLNKENIVINYHKISIPKNNLCDSLNYINNYFKLFIKIIMLHNPKVIIVTAAYLPTIIAIKRIASLFRRKNIIICLHAMIEHKPDIYVENMKKMGKNVKFITYSDACNCYLKECGINSCYFIHHPYVVSSSIPDNSSNEKKIRVGIIGQCANDNALNIVKACAEDEYLTNRLVFYVASNCRKTSEGLNIYGKYDNVRIIGNELTTDERNSLLNELDYILLPYGKMDYRLSASGVFWDAISRNICFLSYDSPYIIYYSQYFTDGYIAYDFSQMISNLKRITVHIKMNSYENILSDLDSYNIETIKKLIYERKKDEVA